MAQNDVDLCNPLAVWQLFIQFLSGDTPDAASPPPSNLPTALRPPMLLEPDLEIRPDPDTGGFLVGKPDFGLDDLLVRPDAEFLVVKKFDTQADADAFVQKTPRVRLPLQLQDALDSMNRHTALPNSQRFNWHGDPDAVRTGARFNDILIRIPLVASLPTDTRFVKLRLAHLGENTAALHYPNQSNVAESFVFIDPFKISYGVVQLASVYIHELTHAKFYRDRGFIRSHELIPLLSREEYVLVVLDEELTCFNNEVEAVRQFLASCPANLQAAASRWIDASIEPPVAYHFSDAYVSDPPSVLENATREAVADIYRLQTQAEYDRVRGSALSPGAAAQAWVTSAEWTAIQGTLPLWQRAEAL